MYRNLYSGYRYLHLFTSVVYNENHYSSLLPDKIIININQCGIVYFGAVKISRAKSLMSLHKNVCINVVRRASRSFSGNDRNMDFDVFPFPFSITRPNIVAGITKKSKIIEDLIDFLCNCS